LAILQICIVHCSATPVEAGISGFSSKPNTAVPLPEFALLEKLKPKYGTPLLLAATEKLKYPVSGE
jgi:hypothetical protein